MLEVQNISRIFPGKDGPVTAIRNVSFRVEAGEVLGLIGPSGAGKSTSLRSLNLLERPGSGAVRLEGRDLLGLSTSELALTRQKVGMIFQHFHLLANRTVEQNVALALEIAGWKKGDIQKRVDEVLTIVGLKEKAQVYPAKLSGGQKQRVAIARGIANHPKLLLADEPTSALDPLTKQEVVSCLLDLNRKLGLTIVIATHDMSVARRLCHRALLFKDHQIHEEIIIEDGRLEPRSDFGRYFLEVQ